MQGLEQLMQQLAVWERERHEKRRLGQRGSMRRCLGVAGDLRLVLV